MPAASLSAAAAIFANSHLPYQCEEEEKVLFGCKPIGMLQELLSHGCPSHPPCDQASACISKYKANGVKTQWRAKKLSVKEGEHFVQHKVVTVCMI